MTEFVRSQTDGFVSFLIVQDHRWDVALPSLTTGDTQSDGIKITSRETGGNGPLLRVITKNTAPRFTIQPFSQTVTAGQPVTFTAQATGEGTLAYQWYRNNTLIQGATSTS